MIFYQEIFEERGLEFAQASQKYEDSIWDELNKFVIFADIKVNDWVLDAAAAGGFLSKHLQQSKKAQVISLDPCFHLSRLAFENGIISVCSTINKMPFKNRFDKILCLVSLHHEQNLQQFFNEAFEILKSDGSLVIAEVEQKTAPAYFLNEFVDQHSTLGHKGEFFTEHYLDKIQKAGFLISESKYQSYHWKFQSKSQMGDAVKMMFGIDRASLSLVIHGIEKILGTDQLKDSFIGMRWGLRYVYCVKRL